MGILSFFFGSSPNKPGVYRIRNTANGREYIGATSRPIRQRWAQHYSHLRGNCHSNRDLQSDWNSYGESAFEFSVIENLYEWDRIFERERYWQDKGYVFEQRYNPQNGTIQEPRWVQAKRLRNRNNLPFASPEEFEQLLAFFESTPITDEQFQQVIDALRSTGNIR